MNEQTKNPTELQGPAPGTGIFDDPDDRGGLVTVSSGFHEHGIPVGGMSVGEIRRRFADRLDIDPNSLAVLDGQDVGEDTVVRTGQKLRFTHRAGEKGCGLCHRHRAAVTRAV